VEELKDTGGMGGGGQDEVGLQRRAGLDEAMVKKVEEELSLEEQERLPGFWLHSWRFSQRPDPGGGEEGLR
jgi:hypothetical protein